MNPRSQAQRLGVVVEKNAEGWSQTGIDRRLKGSAKEPEWVRGGVGGGNEGGEGRGWGVKATGSTPLQAGLLS